MVHAVESSATDLEHFFSELGGGVFAEQLGLILSHAALKTCISNDKKKTGKINLEFNIKCINADKFQVVISHKLASSVPTKNGKKMEEETTETHFFVGRNGKLSINQPQEDGGGQFGLITQEDGK